MYYVCFVIICVCEVLGPAGCAGLDLARAQADDEVRDEGVLQSKVEVE